MIRSLSSTGSVPAYPLVPVQPVAPVPGSSPDEAQNAPAADTQIDRLKAFEDYLNGQAAGAPGSAGTTANSQSDLSAQLQAFEAYLTGQPAPGSSAQAPSGFTAADSAKQSVAQNQTAQTVLSGLQQQADAFEAYLNQTYILQQSYNAGNSGAQSSGTDLFSPDEAQTSDFSSLGSTNLFPIAPDNSPDTAVQPPQESDGQTSGNSPAISASQGGTTNAAQSTPPPDFGSVINALVRYLSQSGAAAISDPIQGATTAPIPTYQTLAGRQDPLPVNGAEQTQKTATTASDQKHEVHNEGLEARWLEQEIANQIAIQKSLRPDPTTAQQDNPDAKKPGLAVPV